MTLHPRLDDPEVRSALRLAWAASHEVRLVGVLEPGLARALYDALLDVPYTSLVRRDPRSLHFRQVFEPADGGPLPAILGAIEALVRDVSGVDRVRPTTKVTVLRYRKGCYLEPHSHHGDGVRFELDLGADVLTVADLSRPHEVPLVEEHTDMLAIAGLLYPREVADSAPPDPC